MKKCTSILSLRIQAYRAYTPNTYMLIAGVLSTVRPRLEKDGSLHIDLVQCGRCIWHCGSSNQGQGFTFYPPNYLIGIFTCLKLRVADAIHNFKWVKIIQIDKMEVDDFLKY